MSLCVSVSVKLRTVEAVLRIAVKNSVKIKCGSTRQQHQALNLKTYMRSNICKQLWADKI